MEKPPEGDAFGQALAAAAAAAPPHEIWPENWAAVHLFIRLGTQWRVTGMGGYTGLCYEAVYPLIDRMGLSAEDWDQMLDDVMCMERAALNAMRDTE